MRLGKRYTFQIAALHTSLQSVVTTPGDADSDGGSRGSSPVAFTPYDIPDVQPTHSNEEFQVKSRAMVHFSSLSHDDQDQEFAQPIRVDGIFLFLYEVSTPGDDGSFSY